MGIAGLCTAVGPSAPRAPFKARARFCDCWRSVVSSRIALSSKWGPSWRLLRLGEVDGLDVAGTAPCALLARRGDRLSEALELRRLEAFANDGFLAISLLSLDFGSEAVSGAVGTRSSGEPMCCSGIIGMADVAIGSATLEKDGMRDGRGEFVIVSGEPGGLPASGAEPRAAEKVKVVSNWGDV